MQARELKPAIVVAALFAAAASLAVVDLGRRLPGGDALGALFSPDPTRTDEMLVNVTIYSRMAVVLMVGAALGLSGAVLQLALRNPLAEPATIGVSAGAHITLAIASVWFPAALAFGREGPALFGALLATGAVLALSWRQGLSPVTVVLAGLVVSLYCGAMAAVVTLFNHDALVGLFIWGAGFMDQQGWAVAKSLAPQLGVLALFAALLARPLAVLGLGEEGARSLGLSLPGARLAALGLAAALSALTVVAVGVVSFVGLAGPALARMAGARRPIEQLIYAPLFGSGLLWLTDEIVLLLPVTYRGVPTGALTALVGAPLLIWLLPRLKATALPSDYAALAPTRRPDARTILIALLGATAAAAVVSLALGADEQGFRLALGGDFADFLPWRASRTTAAFAGGAMLALAGAILQRLTGNPMASPEVLGVATGATLGVIGLMFLVEYPERAQQIAAGAAGASLVLAFMLRLGSRSGYSSDRLLLAGVAASSLFGVVMAVLTASQDPRLGMALAWLSGSTYGVSDAEAVISLALALAGFATIPLVARWLDLAPLGPAASSSVGVSPIGSRLTLLSLTAALTAAATVIVGPLSFAGLMGPHLARALGLRRAAAHLAGSALVGGCLMIWADALGRTLIFPFQIPAGLLAAVLGGPYLLWLLRARR